MMVNIAKTAQEFIQGSFSPVISVLCSPKVENVAAKNNLTFTELLQPFTTMNWEGQFREPGGSVCTVKNWKLIVRDVNWKPLQPTEARRQLNNAALHNYNEKTVPLELNGRKLDVSQSTPWFDAWRETYLEVQFPSDHEYTKHFLSCLLVGTSHDDNITDTFNTLNQQFAQLQNVTPPKLPKWFNSDILKSYLLVHDVSSVPKEKADAAFETLKHNFGSANCFMLMINSKSTTDPSLPTDFWTQYIMRGSDTQITNVDLSSSLTSTPIEPQVAFPPPGNRADDNITGVTNLETSHPLTTTENEIYDNANSLQTHSFSGSSESVSVLGKVVDYSTEVHGAAMNANDIDAIKKFLQEYASKSVLPHIEKQIAVLSEGAATKKGVSRSLISATKRWFNPGKPGVQAASNAVIYSSDCPELQLRRLGDLWFMTGQWQRAFDAYHTAKREFYADSAWLCYAGALEMAGLSAFMAGEANKKTHAYMEESIVTYLNTCRMVQYAVRATLLSVLCLSSAGYHGEAAKQLIRMTSEDSDLRSAMLLEQAALCFLSGPGTKAMCRKYAFHMVLAGHRFSKSGQKKHAYRCYKQAYQIYAESGWRLATDHVQFALGRLALALRMPREAVRWLRGPLAPLSPQPPQQQRAFLHEYMMAHQQWLETSDDFKDLLPILPLPLLESEATAVLCVGPVPLASPGRVQASSLSLHADYDSSAEQYWPKMEEMILQVAQGSVPMIFKPTIDFYGAKTDTNPVVPQAEPIQISITLRNPLKISLVLKEVELLWQFVPSSDASDEPNYDILNNEPAVAAGIATDANVICGQKIKSVLLEGDSKKIITFALTPLQVGRLNVQGLAYKLYNPPIEGSSDSGSVMISGKLDLLSGANDKRLQITVIPHAPCLQMTFSETNPEMISGEMRSIDVELRNVGPVEMRNVHIATSHPECLCLVTSHDALDGAFSALYEDKYLPPPALSDERAQRISLWRRRAARHTARAVELVPRSGCVRARLLLRASAHAPSLCLLAYYETGAKARPYRLLRHVFKFKVTEAVELAITPKRSLRTQDGTIFENMNMAVEVKNVCSDKDISIAILEASLLGRQWKLTDLTAARNKDDALNAHERLHIVFKARRILEDLPEGKVEYSCLKVSNIPDSADDVNVSPYSKFVMECKPTSVDFSEAIYLDSKKSVGLIQSMFVLRWKAHDKVKNRKAIGQHCLWLECFTKAESSDKKRAPLVSPSLEDIESKTNDIDTKKSNDVAVVFRLEHSSHINHNFEEAKLCLVPITINIVNCYQVPVEVFIDMSKPPNRELSALGWTGALSKSPDDKQLGVSVSLDRLEARRVALRAVCAAPGTYAVGATLTVTIAAPKPSQPPLTTKAVCANNASLLVVQQAA